MGAGTGGVQLRRMPSAPSFGACSRLPAAHPLKGEPIVLPTLLPNGQRGASSTILAQIALPPGLGRS